MLAPQSRTYESHSLRLHYADWGNESAPPLILVHGGRDHCRSWDVIARSLQPHFHVLAPDLRGHGDSDWTRGGSYALTESHHRSASGDSHRPFDGRHGEPDLFRVIS